MKSIFQKYSVHKKILLIAISVLFCLLILPAFQGERITADAYTPVEEAALEGLYREVDDLLAALDTQELQDYLDSLSDYDGTDIKETLSSLITGDFALDYSSLWQSVLSLIWQEGQTMLPAFAVILAASLLCGIVNSA